MKATLLTVGCVCVLLVMATGCRRANPAITVSPSDDELPKPNRNIPTLSARIGVEGELYTVKPLPVPDFPEVKPTPQEQAVLGEEPKEPELDVLAFHRPTRGPEHGVSPESLESLAGVYGWGGASTGLESAYQSYGVYGFGGVSSQLSSSAAPGAAGVGLARESVGFVGPPWSVSVGEGAPSKISAHALYYDR